MSESSNFLPVDKAKERGTTMTDSSTFLPKPQPQTFVVPDTGKVDTPAFAKKYLGDDKELLDDMFGDEPGQAERRARFDAAMRQSTADGNKNAAIFYAKRQARALLEACRSGDKAAMNDAWATVQDMDGAFNVVLQLVVTLAELTDEDHDEPEELRELLLYKVIGDDNMIRGIAINLLDQRDRLWGAGQRVLNDVPGAMASLSDALDWCRPL